MIALAIKVSPYLPWPPGAWHRAYLCSAVAALCSRWYGFCPQLLPSAALKAPSPTQSGALAVGG